MRARQKVSRAGVELIKSFEGLRQNAARLPDGRWTIGYGHTFSARENARVTQEDADALLRFDLLPIVDSLNNMVLVPLNQNQFDALVSFSFNIGIENFGSSSVLKRINEGRMTEAALAMDAWRSAEFNGQTYVLAPLIRRRASEKNLFLTPEDNRRQRPACWCGRWPMSKPMPPPPARPRSMRPIAAACCRPTRPVNRRCRRPRPRPYAFTPQPAAPQPNAPKPVSISPPQQPSRPVRDPPATPRPAAAPASPYAASTYAQAEVPGAPALPLSPYAGTSAPRRLSRP